MDLGCWLMFIGFVGMTFFALSAGWKWFLCEQKLTELENHITSLKWRQELDEHNHKVIVGRLKNG